MKASDIADTVVTKLIAQIEAGTGTWEMPWRTTSALGIPFNATTGVAYRGGNIVALWLTQLDRGYSTPRWATYRQWAAADHQVVKGQKGTHLIHWAVKETVNDDGTVSKRMIPNSFVVFHVEQTEYTGEHPELEELANEPLPYTPDAFDELLAAVPATIAVGRPAYSFTLDRVMMPPRESFTTHSAYQGTLAHELVHWTGHESRLDRTFGKRFGDQAYAIEELTAELGAAMLCAANGCTPPDRSDHAAYLANWIAALKAEPMVLWSVAGAAQKAVDHIVHYAEDQAVRSAA